MHFSFMVLLLFIIILAWNYLLGLFVRNQQSNQQEGLGHCCLCDKGFASFPTIMPSTGECEEVINEEGIIEHKQEKGIRKTAVTKTRHN